jgi:hypothetical protein
MCTYVVDEMVGKLRPPTRILHGTHDVQGWRQSLQFLAGESDRPRPKVEWQYTADVVFLLCSTMTYNAVRRVLHDDRWQWLVMRLLMTVPCSALCSALY